MDLEDREAKQMSDFYPQKHCDCLHVQCQIIHSVAFVDGRLHTSVLPLCFKNVLDFFGVELSYINKIYTSRFADGDKHQGCRLIHCHTINTSCVFLTIILY